jgi:hypothetical protein
MARESLKMRASSLKMSQRPLLLLQTCASKLHASAGFEGDATIKVK